MGFLPPRFATDGTGAVRDERRSELRANLLTKAGRRQDFCVGTELHDPALHFAHACDTQAQYAATVQ